MLDSPVWSISSRARLVLYLHSFIIGVVKGVLKKSTLGVRSGGGGVKLQVLKLYSTGIHTN